MKLLIALSLFVASAAGAATEIKKYKTMSEFSGSLYYSILCTGKNGTDTVYAGYKIDRRTLPGTGVGPVTKANVAVVSPNAGLYVREMQGSGFMLQNTPGAMQIISYGTPMNLVMNDATNGKFKGSFSFNDQLGVAYARLDVNCVVTNYELPARPE